MLPGFVWDVGVRAAFLGRGRNFLSSLVHRKSPIKQSSACLLLGKRVIFKQSRRASAALHRLAAVSPIVAVVAVRRLI
jgi:hypothetical protein